MRGRRMKMTNDGRQASAILQKLAGRGTYAELFRLTGTHL